MDRKIMAALFAAVLLAAGALLPGRVFAQTENRAQFQAMYLKYLETEGFPAEIDEDGDILFRQEGRVYFIIVNDSDPAYFQILFPNFWRIESEADQQRAAAACSEVNRTTKIARVFLVSSGRNTSIIADVLLPSPKDFSAVFSRMMGTIATARGKFLDEIRR
ncbi:MAG: YbjN domain-containing protein [Spirochaetaceae bacterium]|jgi:hypothetical protein|nr:YbjN domain-containing protein [Spirochaetaceae bacterium]